MHASRQAGFTLVELMVAMLVGSIVVLGAGYLFLTTLQTFQKVDELSRKQETVIFAAHTLSAGIRQSKDGKKPPYDLQCEVNKEEDDQCKCTLRDTSPENKNQPLVTFDRPLDSAKPSDKDCALENPPDFEKNVVKIPLPLEAQGEALTFRVAKRQPILNKYLGNDDTAPEGDK